MGLSPSTISCLWSPLTHPGIWVRCIYPREILNYGKSPRYAILSRRLLWSSFTSFVKPAHEDGRIMWQTPLEEIISSTAYSPTVPLMLAHPCRITFWVSTARWSLAFFLFLPKPECLQPLPSSWAFHGNWQTGMVSLPLSGCLTALLSFYRLASRKLTTSYTQTCIP